MASQTPISQQPRYTVRFSPGLKERIEEAARQYRRSLNSEILARLDRSFEGLPRDEAASTEAHADDRFAFRSDITDAEARLLRRFRRLSTRQQEALLNLLSG